MRTFWVMLMGLALLFAFSSAASAVEKAEKGGIKVVIQEGDGEGGVVIILGEGKDEGDDEGESAVAEGDDDDDCGQAPGDDDDDD